MNNFSPEKKTNPSKEPDIVVKPTGMTRRSFLSNAAGGVSAAIGVTALGTALGIETVRSGINYAQFNNGSPESEQAPRIPITPKKLRNLWLDSSRFSYKRINQVNITDLKMPKAREKSDKLDYTALVRTLGFRSITQHAEEKYNISPRYSNLLLAIIMTESSGDLFSINSSSNAAGLVQFMRGTGKEYGLITTGNVTNAVAELKDQPEELAKKDERFHPVMVIDAMARMIAANMAEDPLPASDSYPNMGNLNNDPIKRSLALYFGTGNVDGYYGKIMRFMELLNDRNTESMVEKEFNKSNNEIMIDGKFALYVDYIKARTQENMNWGLNEYVDGKKYEPISQSEYRRRKKAGQLAAD